MFTFSFASTKMKKKKKKKKKKPKSCQDSSKVKARVHLAFRYRNEDEGGTSSFFLNYSNELLCFAKFLQRERSTESKSEESLARTLDSRVLTKVTEREGKKGWMKVRERD